MSDLVLRHDEDGIATLTLNRPEALNALMTRAFVGRMGHCASLLYEEAIRDYAERTGFKVGYKPAGGISKAKDALVYMALMKDELGDRWVRPDLFRFGASSLLGDIERQLEHHVTGRYSAGYRHALA